MKGNSEKKVINRNIHNFSNLCIGQTASTQCLPNHSSQNCVTNEKYFSSYCLCGFKKESHTRPDHLLGVKNIEEGKCFVIISKRGCVNSSPLPGQPHRFSLRAASSGRSGSAGDCSREATQAEEHPDGWLLAGRGTVRKAPSSDLSGH